MEPRPFKRLKRLLRYLVLRVLFAAVNLLPLGVAKWLGARLGRLGFRLAGSERRKALDSLSVAFPDKSPAERLELARACFEHMGLCAAEFCLSEKINPRLASYVELAPEDEATLREAIAEGRGVLFVTGHVGNFELMARRIAALGHPSCTVAKPSSDPRLTAFLERMRGGGGVGIIWRGQGPGRTVAAMEQALAANHMVGLLIDQDTRVRGTFVDFFGKPAHTPRLPAELALRTGAAVVCGFASRRPDGGHRVRIERIETVRRGELDADAQALTQTLSLAIERAIRAAPHAWVWNHRRWKTRPPEDRPEEAATVTSSRSAVG